MASSPNHIILLRLRKDMGGFDQTFGIEQKGLVAKYNAVVVTEAARLQLSGPNQPNVVIVADNGVVQREHLSIQAELGKYVKAGGCVIFAFQIASTCTRHQLESFFWHFDRHWSLASSELNSLTRMNFIANPALKGLLGMAGAELTETYAIHAVHLLGVADHEKLYIPYEQEHESIQLITGHEEACSAAFTRVGDGLFGYVGDFTFELGTRGVIKAMINRAIMPDQKARLSAHSSPTSQRGAPSSSVPQITPPSNRQTVRRSSPDKQARSGSVTSRTSATSSLKSRTSKRVFTSSAAQELAEYQQALPIRPPRPQPAGVRSTVPVKAPAQPIFASLAPVNATMDARSSNTSSSVVPTADLQRTTPQVPQQTRRPETQTRQPPSPVPNQYDTTDHSTPGPIVTFTGCIVCGTLPAHRCPGCRRVKYCSVMCQDRHWIASHHRCCAKEKRAMQPTQVDRDSNEHSNEGDEDNEDDSDNGSPGGVQVLMEDTGSEDFPLGGTSKRVQVMFGKKHRQGSRCRLIHLLLSFESQHQQPPQHACPDGWA